VGIDGHRKPGEHRVKFERKNNVEHETRLLNVEIPGADIGIAGRERTGRYTEQLQNKDPPYSVFKNPLNLRISP